ncbi:MAG TPA: twin-arginine translocase subunit TatC [Gammaproteobacteria bacterium]|nr:twin-arginine translocase subunit TatC [Gammaproteobacteria bacterium]
MSESIESEQPFLSHLFELRDRLLRIVMLVLVVFLGLFFVANDLFTMVARPLMDAYPGDIIAIGILSPFLTPIKLALVASIFLTIPFIFYQMWAFIAPGLYKHERKLVMPLVVSSTFLFYLGVLFAYYVVFPLVFAFLSSISPEGVNAMPDIAAYLDFVLTLFFAFGLAFEIPIATIILVWMGMVTPEQLTKKRPYVIVGAFVIGMFLTPPDIISQTLLAIPMWVLFEVGIFFSRFFVRTEEEIQAAQSAAGDNEDTPEDASAAAATAGYPDDYVAPTDAEMEAELDRIEAEEELEQAASESSERIVEEDDDDSYMDEEFDDDDEDAVAIIEDVVDSKLQRVMTLRDDEKLEEARKLLYEVLAEGNEEQVGVARNILEQLDS